MSDMVDKEIEQLTNNIFQNMKKLRNLKINHNKKLGFSLCVGGILNSYREGDLSFDEATKFLMIKES